ncbi:MAG: methyltransferase domain-containing protein [Desulfobacterium sp.]|nr:methyltransferase domain-containing protein [Desulfobacterium sp.]
MAEHLCPVWIGNLLSSPLRKMIQNPEKILLPHVTPGMTVVDVGCAMGFFSIPMAGMVGSKGRVVGVDIQEKMLHSLKKRAVKAGVESTMDYRLCVNGSLGLEDLDQGVDFILAFAVVHEVQDPATLFAETFRALKPGATFLLCEPRGHVSQQRFGDTVAMAQACGYRVVDSPRVPISHAVLLEK